ncbi:MAG: polymerase, partial [Nocardioidaceae bacterium]|nr:polymerase [Nocardioidaceae bacterium]
VRLLGVGVSGLADWIQEDLFEEYPGSPDDPSPHTPSGDSRDGSPDEVPSDTGAEVEALTRARRWAPGMDVVHAVHGPGWVWGSGVGRVTVRFETAETGPGPVRTFRADDPELARPPTPSP